MEVILKMTVTMIFMGTWTWTKNREMKEKVGVALRNNFVRTGRAPKGLRSAESALFSPERAVSMLSVRVVLLVFLVYTYKCS